MRPIVVNLRKKKKRRYTSALRDVQVRGRALSRISTRLVEAVADGMRRYDREADRSARRKRDGTLRDLQKNTLRGFRKTLRRAKLRRRDLAKLVAPMRAGRRRLALPRLARALRGR